MLTQHSSPLAAATAASSDSDGVAEMPGKHAVLPRGIFFAYSARLACGRADVRGHWALPSGLARASATTYAAVAGTDGGQHAAALSRTQGTTVIGCVWPTRPSRNISTALEGGSLLYRATLIFGSYSEPRTATARWPTATAYSAGICLHGRSGVVCCPSAMPRPIGVPPTPAPSSTSAAAASAAPPPAVAIRHQRRQGLLVPAMLTVPLLELGQLLRQLADLLPHSRALVLRARPAPRGGRAACSSRAPACYSPPLSVETGSEWVAARHVWAVAVWIVRAHRRCLDTRARCHRVRSVLFLVTEIVRLRLVSSRLLVLLAPGRPTALPAGHCRRFAGGIGVRLIRLRATVLPNRAQHRDR